MNTIAEKIEKTGLKVAAVEESKGGSTYFYIPVNGIQLVARISNHDAMCAASKAHVQVLVDRFLHLDFDFEKVYDEDDYEVELTKEEAARQLTNYFGVEISENEVEEADEYNCKLDAYMDWKKMETIIANYISIKIKESKPTNIF